MSTLLYLPEGPRAALGGGAVPCNPQLVLTKVNKGGLRCSLVKYARAVPSLRDLRARARETEKKEEVRKPWQQKVGAGLAQLEREVLPAERRAKVKVPSGELKELLD